MAADWCEWITLFIRGNYVRVGVDYGGHEGVPGEIFSNGMGVTVNATATKFAI
jgi:hypothetical protein